MSSLRLGDTLEDYCLNCRRLLDHAVAALVNDQPVKVVCRTCGREHDFKHGQLPVRKQKLAKVSAFDQVLAGILATQPAAPETGSEPKPKPRKRKP